MFRDATRPADKANPVGIAINNMGDICHAASDKMTGGLGVSSSYVFAIVVKNSKVVKIVIRILLIQCTVS